jgi:hypothetical protein
LNKGFLERVETRPSVPLPSSRTTCAQSYADAALRNRVRDVISAPEGQRNETLVRAAYQLRPYINGGALDEPFVIDELSAAARMAGLNEFEIAATIQSGFNGSDDDGRSPISLEPTYPEPTHYNGHSEVRTTSSFEDRLLTPAGLRSLPEPTPLIDNVLDRGTTSLLYGKWASSKSFIALDWACSVATGRPWQGRGTDQMRVLYVVAEGVAGFASRVNAWEIGWQTEIDEKWMSFLPMPVNLMAGEVEAFIDLVRREGYGFIVLDTLARCMVGGEENSARDAGIVVDAMTELMYATPEHRGVVLGVHHTGKDGKTLRGSSAFESGVDTVYFTERDGQTVTLCRTKRKDGPPSDVHRLRLSDIQGSDSCVVEAAPPMDDELGGSESVALLREIFSELFSVTGVSNAELRQVALDHGMSQASFYRARGELLKEGWLVNTGTGPRAFFEVCTQVGS